MRPTGLVIVGRCAGRVPHGPIAPVHRLKGTAPQDGTLAPCGVANRQTDIGITKQRPLSKSRSGRLVDGRSEAPRITQFSNISCEIMDLTVTSATYVYYCQFKFSPLW
jgi:hypothetical protein